MKDKHIYGAAYDHGKTDKKAWSDEHSVLIEGDSLTIQDQADDTNINVIMRRAGVLGRMPDPNTVRLPHFDDFTEIPDYSTALMRVLQANQSFQQFPAEFRTKFDNDPERFIDYCLDPANTEDLYKRGMLNDAAKARYEKGVQDAADAAYRARRAAEDAATGPTGAGTAKPGEPPKV